MACMPATSLGIKRQWLRSAPKWANVYRCGFESNYPSLYAVPEHTHYTHTRGRSLWSLYIHKSSTLLNVNSADLSLIIHCLLPNYSIRQGDDLWDGVLELVVIPFSLRSVLSRGWVWKYSSKNVSLFPYSIWTIKTLFSFPTWIFAASSTHPCFSISDTLLCLLNFAYMWTLSYR